MHQAMKRHRTLRLKSWIQQNQRLLLIANQTKEVNTPIDSIKIEAKDNSGQKVTKKVSGPEGVSFDSETNTLVERQQRGS